MNASLTDEWRAPLECVPLAWSRVLYPGPLAGPLERFRWPALLLFLLLPALLLYPWRDFHLLEPDEGRYAQIPREMLERGEWIVPTLMGEPYLDKPPLFYWLVMASYALFGPSPAAARLVPALAVHLTILGVYLLGRRSLGERAAFWGALLLTVAPGFTSIGRLLLLDGLLTLWVTYALLTAFEATRTGRLLIGWWLVSAGCCALGVLTKGPIALLLIAGPLVAYGWLMSRSAVPPARPGLRGWLSYGLLVIGINAPWYLAVSMSRPEFGGYFFWKHNLQRFLTPFDHLQPVWYYVPLLFAFLLPGSLLLAWFLRYLLAGGAQAGRRSPEQGFWLLAGGWCVLFFSLSGSKLPTYILPGLPALALALGAFVAATNWPRYRSWQATMAMAVLFLGVVHAVGLPWYARMRSPLWQEDVIVRYCGDPTVPVVCYPRHCDSVGFHLGRDDLLSMRSKHAVELARWLEERPRAVVLFTHRHSLDALRHTLPPTLQLTSHTPMRRSFPGQPLLQLLVGETPWGLCDVALVERK